MYIYFFDNKNEGINGDEKENAKKKYYCRFCSQTNIISKADFLLSNCITWGGIVNWALVSLYLRKGERRDHWIHLELLYRELHKTAQGQSAWHLGGGHVFFTQGQKILVGRLQPVWGGQQPAKWITGCGDRKPHRSDTNAWTPFLGGRAPRRSHRMPLWRTLAGCCPAHVIFAYHSNASQSPLEIPDWFHWWITPATCTARSKRIDIWGNLKNNNNYQKRNGWCLFVWGRVSGKN